MTQSCKCSSCYLMFYFFDNFHMDSVIILLLILNNCNWSHQSFANNIRFIILCSLTFQFKFLSTTSLNRGFLVHMSPESSLCLDYLDYILSLTLLFIFVLFYVPFFGILLVFLD